MQVSHISASTPQDEAKLLLLDEIDTFIQEKITYADEQVARTAQTKVEAGDVILTFAFSSAVLNTLLAAKKVRRLQGMLTFPVLVWRSHVQGCLGLMAGSPLFDSRWSAVAVSAHIVQIRECLGPAANPALCAHALAYTCWGLCAGHPDQRWYCTGGQALQGGGGRFAAALRGARHAGQAAG